MCLLVAAWFGGCTPAASHRAGAPAAAPSPTPDLAYEALTVERDRQGLGAELAPLLGKNVSTASGVSKVFSGAPQVEIPDGHGGSFRIWHREGEPWILRVDASGTIIAYDLPTQGIIGRRPGTTAALHGQRQGIMKGLDDMVGLPIDSLIGDEFRPIDSTKFKDGRRIYTFRTPEDYFLSLSTDANGVITGWSSDVPGIARPLHPSPQAKR